MEKRLEQVLLELNSNKGTGTTGDGEGLERNSAGHLARLLGDHILGQIIQDQICCYPDLLAQKRLIILVPLV